MVQKVFFQQLENDRAGQESGPKAIIGRLFEH